MERKTAIRRSQMMSLGAFFAILAYILVILAKAFHSIFLELGGEVFAGLAGVVFYAGFVAPAWLRRMWGENEK